MRKARAPARATSPLLAEEQEEEEDTFHYLSFPGYTVYQLYYHYVQCYNIRSLYSINILSSIETTPLQWTPHHLLFSKMM